jgi:hypothetical protein
MVAAQTRLMKDEEAKRRRAGDYTRRRQRFIIGDVHDTQPFTQMPSKFRFPDSAAIVRHLSMSPQPLRSSRSHFSAHAYHEDPKVREQLDRLITIEQASWIPPMPFTSYRPRR